jgi:hypothetical protein
MSWKRMPPYPPRLESPQVLFLPYHFLLFSAHLSQSLAQRKELLPF